MHSLEKTCRKCGFTAHYTFFSGNTQLCKKCKLDYDYEYKKKRYEEYTPEVIKNSPVCVKKESELIIFIGVNTNEDKKRIAEAEINYIRGKTAKRTPYYRVAERRRKAERRALGFNPINSYFKDSHYHHLHLNGNKNIGLFIPASLHESLRHCSKTGRGMREINKASLLWLCEQSIIKPD